MSEPNRNLKLRKRYDTKLMGKDPHWDISWGEKQDNKDFISIGQTTTEYLQMTKNHIVLM